MCGNPYAHTRLADSQSPLIHFAKVIGLKLYHNIKQWKQHNQVNKIWHKENRLWRITLFTEKKITFTFMSMFRPVEKALQALMAHRW